MSLICSRQTADQCTNTPGTLPPVAECSSMHNCAQLQCLLLTTPTSYRMHSIPQSEVASLRHRNVCLSWTARGLHPLATACNVVLT